MAFDRLFYVRLGYIGLGDCPAGLKPPVGAKNKRKVAVKNKESPLKNRCHERDYSIFFYEFKNVKPFLRSHLIF